MGEVIAVLSGKGGTGKTTITAGLACALALDGNRILCIDCDVGLRNLDISLGASDQPSLNFLDICSGGYNWEHLRPHPLYENVYFLTAPMNCSAEEISPESFAAMVHNASRRFDYVFLDAPAGVDAGFRLAASNANRILLVTGPDPAAVRDAGRTGQMLELMGKENVRLIVNRVTAKLVSSMDLTIDDVMDNTGLPLIGVVPEDSNVVLAAAFGKPLLNYSKKGASAACRRIALRLLGLPVRIDI